MKLNWVNRVKMLLKEVEGVNCNPAGCLAKWNVFANGFELEMEQEL